MSVKDEICREICGLLVLASCGGSVLSSQGTDTTGSSTGTGSVTDATTATLTAGTASTGFTTSGTSGAASTSTSHETSTATATSGATTSGAETGTEGGASIGSGSTDTAASETGLGGTNSETGSTGTGSGSTGTSSGTSGSGSTDSSGTTGSTGTSGATGTTGEQCDAPYPESLWECCWPLSQSECEASDDCAPRMGSAVITVDDEACVSWEPVYMWCDMAACDNAYQDVCAAGEPNQLVYVAPETCGPLPPEWTTCNPPPVPACP